jgi:hypothetical protein
MAQWTCGLWRSTARRQINGHRYSCVLCFASMNTACRDFLLVLTVTLPTPHVFCRRSIKSMCCARMYCSATPFNGEIYAAGNLKGLLEVFEQCRPS